MVPELVPHLDLRPGLSQKKKEQRYFGLVFFRGSALGALFGVGYGFLEKEGLFKSSGRNGKPQGYLFSWDSKEKEY